MRDTLMNNDQAGMKTSPPLAGVDRPVLVTGAAGFIGQRVVARLLVHGFTRIRCLVRPSGNPARMHSLLGLPPNDARVQVVEGNLLSRDDCRRIAEGVEIVYHLAAGRGEKSYPDAFLNSVVTTRNLLDACVQHGCLKRFVNVSSFAVYTNRDKPRGRLLDEDCPVEPHPELRGNAYCFAKVKQEEMVATYGRNHGLPFVTLRPGVVYGPGNEQIHGRVGLGTFGLFLHLGGSNPVPLTYVDNCAEAVVLAGTAPGIDGEAFNVVDDDLPSSRSFLTRYKREVRRFRSLYVPGFVSYGLCFLWEKSAAWSQGQLPDAFNRRVWHAVWKNTRYTNEKVKRQIGWKQIVATPEGLKQHFESCRRKDKHA